MFHIPAHKNLESPPGQIVNPVGPAPEVSRPDPLAAAQKAVEDARAAVNEALDQYGIGRHWDAAYTRLQRAKQELNALLTQHLEG